MNFKELFMRLGAFLCPEKIEEKVKIPLCIECRHYSAGYANALCHRPQGETYSFVDGKYEKKPPLYCSCERAVFRTQTYRDSHCGVVAKFFEPKEVK